MGAPKIIVTSPLSWLQITPPSDPQFNAKVNEAIGTDVAGQIAYALPYSVLVTNTGSVPITGIGLLFQVTYPGASSPVMRSFFYHNFQPGQAPVLKPGQSRVFTPLKTATLLAGNAPSSGGVAPNPTRLEDASVVSMAAQIDFSIDLAVSSDWRMAGADLSGFIANTTAQHDALKAMHDEALARLNGGQTDDALRAWLQSMSQQHAPARMVGGRIDRTGSLYASSQAQLAQEWLELLTRTGDRAALQNRIAAVTPEMAFPGVGKFQGGLQ